MLTLLCTFLLAGDVVIGVDGEQTASERSHFLDGERAQSLTLISWGSASVVSGSILAASGALGARGLSIGLNTLGWGAVNTVLGVLFFLQEEAERKKLADEAKLGGAALYRRQEEMIGAYRSQATVFAVNTGLDVFYIAAGAACWLIADRFLARKDSLAGVGISAVMQGIFLFGFDLAGWLLASGRGDALSHLRVVF